MRLKQQEKNDMSVTILSHGTKRPSFQRLRGGVFHVLEPFSPGFKHKEASAFGPSFVLNLQGARKGLLTNVNPKWNLDIPNTTSYIRGRRLIQDEGSQNLKAASAHGGSRNKKRPEL